ncbi:MAG TPA: SDR family NAD(P)-dependent oxidoreductase, partial [Chitinophagaceae bacterium]
RELIEKHLLRAGSPLYGIIHLWSLSIPVQSAEFRYTSDAMRRPGFDSALLLVQTLARRMSVLPRLWFVTRGAQSVIPDEAIAVEQSALWGFAKVISLEFPELKCIRVDLDRGQSIAESVPHLVNQLFIDGDEDQLAIRSGTRYVPRLISFTPVASTGKPAVRLRSDATYLVTGGLGALGLKTAEWLVKMGARHLVLLGRNQPSPLAKKITDQLRQEGIEIVLARADVSDPDQLEKVMENINTNMPLLRGVIHAAGILDDGSVHNLTAERMRKVMAPKVNGSWNLHKATLNTPLDFFVLFSSAVSVLGSPGQGNYAAASSYLDAMAYYRLNLGLPAISINWGPWAEAGLAMEASERLQEQNASNQHLIKVIKIDEGFEILGQLLNEHTAQVVVLPFDLKNLLELYPTAAGMPFFSEIGAGQATVTRLYARPNLRQPYAAPRNEIERRLAELWRQTLHIDRVGIHDSFFELGGDSVLAAQILSLAQKNFGIRINPQDAFRAFTIERLSEMIEADILTKIEEMSEEEAQRLLKSN